MNAYRLGIDRSCEARQTVASMTIPRIILALLGWSGYWLLVALVFMHHDVRGKIQNYDWKYAPLAIYLLLSWPRILVDWAGGDRVVGGLAVDAQDCNSLAWVHVVLTVPVLFFLIFFTFKITGF